MEDKIVKVLGRLIPCSGKVHQNQEVYMSAGGSLMCTLKATHYKDPPKVLVEVVKNEQNNTVRKY